jgi:hypothetical protein
MKTGFDLESEDKFDVEFMRKTVAIMKVLTREALSTSCRFVKSCGREYVTGNDMYYALMYEAHEFFEKSIDKEFFEELEKEREHTYETDDEDEDDEDDEDDGDDGDDGDGDEQNLEINQDDTKETYTVELKDKSELEFHSKVIQYSQEWRDWFPDDPVKQMLKRSIDNTKNSFEQTIGSD